MDFPPLWFIVCYYCYFAAHIVPALSTGPHSGWLLCLLNMPLSFGIFPYFLAPQIVLVSYLPLPSFGSNCFGEESLSLSLREWGLHPEHSCGLWVCSLSPWSDRASSSLSDWAGRRVCILTSTYTCSHLLHQVSVRVLNGTIVGMLWDRQWFSVCCLLPCFVLVRGGNTGVPAVQVRIERWCLLFRPRGRDSLSPQRLLLTSVQALELALHM